MHQYQERLNNVPLWQDILIILFVLFSFFVLYPHYSLKEYKLLAIQITLFLALVLIGGLLRRKASRFISGWQPFVDEIITFTYIFLCLIGLSIILPYLYSPPVITTKVLCFGIIGSILYGVIYLIRVFPSFVPTSLKSLEYLVAFTLECFKLAIMLWILFFIMSIVQFLFIGQIKLDHNNLMVFFTGMLAYTVCALCFLAKTYFGLLQRIDDWQCQINRST